MEPMYLFLDTETNSTYNDKIALQIAWIITDEHGTICKKESHYLKRKISISRKSYEKNGITQEKLMELGEDPFSVFFKLQDDLSMVNYIVAQNIVFDIEVLKKEFKLYNLNLELLDIPSICTMRWSSPYVRAVDKNGNHKNPRLEETAGFLLYDDKDHKFEGLHDAMADTELMMQCFFLLKEKYPPIPLGNNPIVKTKIDTQKNKGENTNDTSLDGIILISDEELDALSFDELFTNKEILVTGGLSSIGFSRKDVEQLLSDFGAIQKTIIGKSLDYLILGEKIGPSKKIKIIKFQQEGVMLKCLNSIQFYRMIEKYKD